MSKRLMVCIFALIVWIVSIGAERRESHQEEIDFAAQGFTKMHTTAYCVGHHTADGSAVYEGGCACSPDHYGDVAILYTLDGEFLGYFYCNDTGKEDGGVRAGNVIDIYRTDYERCCDWMSTTNGFCWIRWERGNG